MKLFRKNNHENEKEIISISCTSPSSNTILIILVILGLNVTPILQSSEMFTLKHQYWLNIGFT